MSWATAAQKLVDLIVAKTPSNTTLIQGGFKHLKEYGGPDKTYQDRQVVVRHVAAGNLVDFDSGTPRRRNRNTEVFVYYGGKTANDFDLDATIASDADDISDALLDCDDYDTATSGLIEVNQGTAEALISEVQDLDNGGRRLVFRFATTHE